jgi:phosphatidylinositol alpha-1,6-mannosyltransferase
LDDDERTSARKQFGLDPERPLVLGVSRLVPRKGFDVVIDAVRGLPDVDLAIAGSGRDRARLEKHAAGAPNVYFLGRIPEEDLATLYGCADVFAMCCRDRWGGLEAEGFGIVFVEAGACGVPAIAGRSGGAHEAVEDGSTGFVVSPRAVGAVRSRIEQLCADPDLRARMGAAARARAESEFAYDRLASLLAPLARGDWSAAGRLRP